MLFVGGPRHPDFSVRVVDDEEVHSTLDRRVSDQLFAERKNFRCAIALGPANVEVSRRRGVSFHSPHASFNHCNQCIRLSAFEVGFGMDVSGAAKGSQLQRQEESEANAAK